jgi:hypothetical protein
VLQWAVANDCKWDSRTCDSAAETGNLGVLQWARSNGCEWDPRSCLTFATTKAVRDWIKQEAGEQLDDFDMDHAWDIEDEIAFCNKRKRELSPGLEFGSAAAEAGSPDTGSLSSSPSSTLSDFDFDL